MSNYGITGWSGGPRQSLTHNLRAGQFRGMGRTNIFPSTTVVNNNFFGNGYGIYDDCCCNNNNSTPSWMNWMMGIGLGTSLLGNILCMFGIGGGGGGVSDTEGGGGTETPKETKEVKASNEKQDEFAGLKVLYPDGKFAKIGDKYRCNIDNQSFEADSIVDLDKQLKEALNKKPETVKPKTDASSVKPSESETQELKDGTFTSAIDEAIGSKSQIKGKVTNNPDGTVSIADTNNTYTYEKGTKTVTYKGKSYTVYSLKGATNNKTGKAVPTTEQEYILINGQLLQPKDCPELAGLGTGSIGKSTPPPTKHRR